MLDLEKFSSAFPEASRSLFGDSTEQIENYGFEDRTVRRKPLVMIFGEVEEVRSLFKVLLQTWSYDVAEASSVEQLIGIARSRPVDLVLMDTKLLILDSLILMKRIKNHPSLDKTPFVLLSGHAQNVVRRTALAAGADDFVVKPVDFEMLEKILKAYLNRIERGADEKSFN